MAIPKKLPIPIPAFAVVLKLDCDPVDPDRGLELELLRLILIASVAVAEIVGLGTANVVSLLVGLPVFGTPYIASILYYKSALGRFTSLLVVKSDIWIAIA